MSELYCIDSSMFINGWRKHYPPSVFPAFWDHLDELIEQGIVISCTHVFAEIQRQRDELADWAKVRKRIFHSPTVDVLHEMRDIMNSFPNFAAKGGARNSADPFVIAHAKVVGGVVVTEEHPARLQKKTKPPKIPDVCDSMGVRHLTTVKFLQELGKKFTS